MRINETAFTLLALCAALGLAAWGCGDNDGDDDNDDNDNDNDDGTSDADSDADGDADGDADSDSDGDADMPYCAQICSGPAGCVPDQSTLITDADNWSCDGHCTYEGCNGDQECDDAYSNLGYGCTADSGWGVVPSCAQLCDTAADCATEYSPAACDEDNYSCNAGGYCKYLGCNDDDECEAMLSGYRCLQSPYLDIPICQEPCQEAADCDYGGGDAVDADNYSCEGQVCVYTGCNSTAECQDSYDSGWECVEP